MTPDAKDLCVFAVKRGDITGRFDVRNLKYSQSQSGKKQEKVSLGSLTSGNLAMEHLLLQLRGQMKASRNTSVSQILTILVSKIIINL